MKAQALHDHRVPLWVISGVLYGLSWPLGNSIHLGFLAWFAFVPLFIALERQHHVLGFARDVLGFVGIATLIQCWWWFWGVPLAIASFTWAGGLQEIILQAAPFFALYSLKKRLSYKRALLILVFLVPLWEWLYAQLPIAVGALLIGYSQASYTWLIQYADTTGVAGVSAWVLAVNVFVLIAYREMHRLPRVRWGLWVGGGSLVLFAIPLAYSALRTAHIEFTYGPTLSITLMHTNFPAGVEAIDERIAQAKDLVHQTTEATRLDVQTDLYVWSESIVDFDWTATAFRDSLQQTVTVWDVPLLLGQAGYRSSGSDSIRTNSAVLLKPREEEVTKRYDKVHLVPFWEGVPGHGWLMRFAPFERYHRANNYYTPGRAAETLPLTLSTGDVIQFGTPICHEQSKPQLWATMAEAGAHAFVQLSFESWFGTGGFETASANIARLRAIENHRPLARSANGGKTVVFDALGREQASHIGHAQALHVAMQTEALSTWYTRFPYGFPLICGLLALALIGPAIKGRDKQ